MDKRFTPAVISAAQAGHRAYKVPASVTLAQWALESAYGKSMPAGSNNPFGIKARPGEPAVSAKTWEVEGGRRVDKAQSFRKFASLAEAFESHGRLLATSRFYTKAMALTAEPDNFARALTGVYATDPNYGTKLISIMQANGLYQFDVSDIGIAARPTPSAASSIVGNALDPKAPARGPSPAPGSATPATPAHKESTMGNLLGSVASIIEGIVSKGTTVATVATVAPTIIEGVFKSADEAERGFKALAELVTDIRGGKWQEVPDDINAIIVEFRQIMINFGIDHDKLNVAATKIADLDSVATLKKAA